MLTMNDRRVLRGVERAQWGFDGYMPHGNADWVAIKRLEAWALVKRGDVDGSCQTCPEPHDGPIYTMTDAGREVVGG